MAAERCLFCPCADKVQPIKIGPACWQCRQVSKKTKKGAGIFYDVLNGQYVEAVPTDARRTALVDLHNVADRFASADMGALANKLDAAGVRVVFLSYVGSTTNTRLDADAKFKELAAVAPKAEAFLCFQRGSDVHPANKGGFAAALGSADLTFLDDGDDHVAAVRAAVGGANAVHVPKDDADAARALIQSTLLALAE